YDPQPFLHENESTAAPHPISCSAQTTFGSQTPPQRGTPGTGERCFGYTLTPIPVSFFDISATGTPLFSDYLDLDDGVIQLDLSSAPFRFHGTPRSSVTLSTNGLLIFNPVSCTYACYQVNRSAPSSTSEPNGLIAVFWDDLYPADLT